MPLPRKHRYRVPRRWSKGLEDLHDYYQPAPRRRVSARAAADDSVIVVTNDWPDVLPVHDAELRVIEGHLAKELDALFGTSP